MTSCSLDVIQTTQQCLVTHDGQGAFARYRKVKDYLDARNVKKKRTAPKAYARKATRRTFTSAEAPATPAESTGDTSDEDSVSICHTRCA